MFVCVCVGGGGGGGQMPSFAFLSFTFLFNLYCFSSLCQRVVLLYFLDIKVNPNLERRRER